MENLSHSRQPTRVSHTSATKRACNGSSFTGKNTYDDVFGGPPRFGAPSLSPRPEDYSEIFGGFHASRATSIPVLDLPLLGDEEMFFEVRSSSFDYGEVFGGFNGLDFAASFEELMRHANSGGDRDHDGDSSDEAWTPAETECLSEESDHSGLDQYSFNGDSYEPINSSKEFNISYHKTDQRSSQDMYNGVTRVAELHSLPECAHVFEETIPLDKAHGQNPEVHVTDDDVNLEFPAGQMREKHLSKMLRSTNGAVDEVKAIGNLESQSTDGRIGSYSNQAFVTISEISFRTQPSELPPPTRPPPMLDSNKGDCWDNKTPTPDKRTGDNSPPYFDVEIDASSAAAASAAAMKEAMENAQAKLRSAKEVMERKGHGVQTHKRVPSKHGGMDKREKARKIADESFDMDDEPLQRAHEKGKHEEKISVTYDGGKAMITTHMLPGSIEGEKHFSVTKKYMEDKQTRKLKSSKGVYNVNGADEWQEAAQFFDLVRTDKLVLEEVREANLLLKNPKIHEPQQKQGKVVTDALKQQRETETEVTTVRQDHDLEKIERDLRLAKEAYWKPESNGRPDVEKQAVRVKVNEKKFEVPQDVSKLEKNATKSRTTQHHSERGKKIPEANEAEKHGRIETRPADNELEIEQVRTHNTYDDPKLQQKQSKHGEMPERGHERKLVLGFEQSDNGKMLKRSLEQEEKERKLKEVRRREEKKKEKEACEQEEKAQKEREAHEREEKEKREGEAREREKEKKDWEARQPEEREKERELRKREEQENKEKEARKREEEEKKKRDELKRKEHEWEEMEARKMEEEDRRIREALIQEKQKMKQTEACEREEEEKRKREILKREEQERKEREARKQEEEAKKERERLEQEENERKQREAFEREENARKEKEWLELEESERIWRMALEQLENERILKQTFWHSENDEKTRKDPEAEELEKKQKEVHEIKEKDRKPRQTADMVKNEKQQKGTVKVEETETRHQLVHEKETNNGLEDASRKEGHGRTNTKFHEKEGIEKMVVIDNKDIRPKEAFDGEGEKKSEYVSVHEETKEVKSEHDTCYNFQKKKIVENMKTVEGNDDLQLENGLKLPAEALEQDTTRKLLDDDDLFQREAKNQAKSVGDEARRNSEKIKSTSRVECNRENQESKFTNGHSGRGKSMETASNQLGKLGKSVSMQALKESTEAGRKADVAKSLFSEGKANVQKISQQVKTSHATEKKDNSIREIHAAEQAGRIKKEREMEMERLRKMEEQREREREREKDRMAVDRVTREARDGAYAESRERAERTAVERATAEARNRTLAEARERLDKACSEAREKSYTEARLRADRTAVERATTEARERAIEKAMAERAAADTNERIERSLSDKYSSSRNNEMRGLKDQQFLRAETFGGSRFSSAYNGVEGESAQRCKARLDRYRRTAERAAKALEEKNMRDLLAQKEQAERHRLAETLGADVKRWASGKEGNLRALLSTLQYILGPDSGWQPIPLTEVITSAAVKKAYRRATLCVHPDKLQQRGASIQQKYICEKVFDLLKEAWNKFNSEER